MLEIKQLTVAIEDKEILQDVNLTIKTGEMSDNIKAPATELDAVQTAMEMENKSYDFYKNQSKNASNETERDFCEIVASEEREHHIILLDYYEYLKDPAGWFVKKEHPSLDGG